MTTTMTPVGEIKNINLNIFFLNVIHSRCHLVSGSYSQKKKN